MPEYTTDLGEREPSFRNWVKDQKIPFDPDDPKSDYDMRGFWAENGDRAENGHFPDTWKTPYHKTFSNESKYAPPDAPRWEGDRLIDKDGNVIADETPPGMSPEVSSAVSKSKRRLGIGRNRRE